MLARQNRLNKREVQSALKIGSRFFVKGATLVITQNNCGHARFAVLVPKKMAPSAQQRNRIKRVYYDCVAGNIKALGGRDFLIITREAVSSVNECERRLKSAMDKIKSKQSL